MTTYNGALFLGEQLDSIFAQQRLPDELIVCDDHSSDETPQLLSEYAGRAPFPMTVVINEQRLGSTKNFEQAIRLCSGDLIALCDQDDVWRPHKLATIERRFDEDQDLGLVFSNGDLIDKNGKQLPGDMWRRFHFGPRLQKLLAGDRAYDLLLSWSFITGATVAFRSSFLSLCLPIPDGIETFIHDRWIAILIAAVARIDPIEEKLIAYRLHRQQQLGAGGPILVRYRKPYQSSVDGKALKALRDRLSGNPLWAAKPKFMHALRCRETHVAVRSSLSGNVLKRFPRVLQEYVSGKYRRYPWGFRHALKDAVVGTQ